MNERPPTDIAHPPFLDPAIAGGAVQPRHAVPESPFYAKDPHVSYGKARPYAYARLDELCGNDAEGLDG